MLKLDAQELRTTTPDPKDIAAIKKYPIYIILDNVLDTYNIGAIFRLADAVAAQKVLLCGNSETPPNSRIKKASINTTEWVQWEYFSHTKDALIKLKAEVPGIQFISIEQNQKSVPFTSIEYKMPIALVVGNETVGVSDEILDMSDYIAELPMFGVNKSLNVMVTLGIVLYQIVNVLS